MRSKIIILIISSYVITFLLAGCQKNMHHMHEAPVAEAVMKHSEHNKNKIMIEISKASIYSNISIIRHHSIESVISYMDNNDAKKSIDFINYNIHLR